MGNANEQSNINKLTGQLLKTKNDAFDMLVDTRAHALRLQRENDNLNKLIEHACQALQCTPDKLLEAIQRLQPTPEKPA